MNGCLRARWVATIAGACMAIHVNARAGTERLGSLRAEARALQTEIALSSERWLREREQGFERLSTLEHETAVLEQELSRARMHLALLKEQDGSSVEDAARADALLEDWRSRGRELVAAVRAHVSDGLPFHKQARLSTLVHVEELLSSGRIADGWEELIRFIADEESMAREMISGRAPVSIEGEELILPTVRIGMAWMAVPGPEGMARATLRCASPLECDDRWFLLPFDFGALSDSLRGGAAALHDTHIPFAIPANLQGAWARAVEVPTPKSSEEGHPHDH